MAILADLAIDGGRYRYLTTMSRLVGPNDGLQRTDAIQGVVIEQESAANSKGFNSETDYRDVLTINAIGTGKYDLEDNLLYVNGQKLKLKMPDRLPEDTDTIAPVGRHWTHYSVYRTQNLLDEQVDLRIAPNTFIWTEDIPIAKIFQIGKISSTTGRMILRSQGPRFSDGDRGATVTLLSGERAVIADVLDTGVASIYNAETGQPFDSDIFNTLGHIGNGVQLQLSRTVVDDSTVEYRVEDKTAGTPDISDLLVGNQLIFDFNELAIVKYVRTEGLDTFIGVFERDGEPYKPAGNTYYNAVYDVTERVWTDFNYDDVLVARLEAASPELLLQTRYHKPLPNGKLGAVAGGGYFTAPYKSSEYYYSQVSRLFRTGYYEPDEQFNDKPVGALTRIKQYPNIVVFFGKNFTYYLDPAVVENIGEAELGEFVPKFPDPRLLTDKVGMLTESNATKVDSGGEIIFTGEPAIRYFDGFKYGDNLADDRIQTSQIVNFIHALVMSWSKRRGLRLWGLFSK